MKPRRFFARVAFGILLLGALGPLAVAAEPELHIYAYDSFVAKGGLGPAIFPIFEKRWGCKIRASSSGNSGQLLTRMQLDRERGKFGAPVVVGLDQALWARARSLLDDFGSWQPEGYAALVPESRVGSGFVPFDYGVFAFVADREALKEQRLAPPTSLRELLGDSWRRKLLLEDPRTSGPGLAFVLYANSVIETWKAPNPGGADFWDKLRGQWLVLAPGWDAAYGLFLKKEAPLVWSYTTSQAYHAENGDASGRYRALIFDEGQPFQVEGAALIKGAAQSESELRLARRFLEFLISPEVQALVPLHNWMLPVRKDTPLPASFRSLPTARKLIAPSTDPGAIDRQAAEWARRVSGAAGP